MRSYRALSLVANVFTIVGTLALIIVVVGFIGSAVSAIGFNLQYWREAGGLVSLLQSLALITGVAIPPALASIVTIAFGEFLKLIINVAEDIHEIRYAVTSKAQSDTAKHVEGIHRKVALLEAYERARGSSKPTIPPEGQS